MFKEPGYDEFLANCIKQGRKEYKAGLGLSLEEAKLQAKKTIERKSED